MSDGAGRSAPSEASEPRKRDMRAELAAWKEAKQQCGSISTTSGITSRLPPSTVKAKQAAKSSKVTTPRAPRATAPIDQQSCSPGKIRSPETSRRYKELLGGRSASPETSRRYRQFSPVKCVASSQDMITPSAQVPGVLATQSAPSSSSSAMPTEFTSAPKLRRNAAKTSLSETPDPLNQATTDTPSPFSNSDECLMDVLKGWAPQHDMSSFTSSDMAEDTIRGVYDERFGLCKPPPTTPEPEDLSGLKPSVAHLRRLVADRERRNKVTPQLILRAALEKMVPAEELEEDLDNASAAEVSSPAQLATEQRGDSDCSPLSPLSGMSLESPHAAEAPAIPPALQHALASKDAESNCESSPVQALSWDSSEVHSRVVLAA